jgi:DNA-binding SARP family transcriptional activator
MNLNLMGGASLIGEGVHTDRLERRTAGLLAYLALEGPTPRSRLAGLLWPCSREKVARNNLAQTLLRLRKLAGRCLVEGADALSLASDVEVDVRDADPFASELLLDGYDYDGSSEFESWLYASREHLARARRRALEDKAHEAEERGDLTRAIALAEKLVADDPLTERAHQRLVRLYLAAGDAAAALRAYKRCKETLRRELGIEPSETTRALAVEIVRRPPRSGVFLCAVPFASCPDAASLVTAAGSSARCV